MEEIFGFVESILFSEEENGFAVLKIKEPTKKELTFVVGTLSSVHVGESLRCQGSWKHHAKFGQQFAASSFETTVPTDLVGIKRYLESGMIKGIGPSYAERIVKKYGVETLRILDESPHKLLSVPGIGEKKIASIIKCWNEQKEIRNVMIFLRGHGVSPSLAQKIYKTYGDESIEKMQLNPYRVAQEIFGIGFKSADKIAQNLGVQKDAPQRIKSGIQHVLWELSSDGHVCYPKDELIEVAEPMLEVDKNLITEQITSLKEEGILVEDAGNIWIKPLFLSEIGIAKELARLLIAPCSLRGVDTEKAIEWAQTNLRIQLAAQQIDGVSTAINEKMMILTGGPGTGKSTITNAILRILEKLTKKILLAAPTGRAAKRLSEITHKKAFTIHALLQMDFKVGKFRKGKEDPLSCELIIIDEASMIDTYLMNSLLKAIPSTARVIFVGDIDQLPSVGPGNVLRDMINSNTLPVVRLTEIFRQARGSHIITNAHKINKGEFPYLQGEKDFRFIEGETPESIEKSLIKLVTRDAKQFKDFQILCPMKRGVIGTENLNRVMQNLLNPSSNPLLRMGKCFHKEDKIMQIRNNYQKEVFNGDVGKIIAINHTEETLLAEFDGKQVPYEFGELDELVLAYAVSIHKYQGSECPCVIIPIHTSHFKLLHRNLLYTGVTRGKKMVYLVGTKKAIAIAVKNEEVQQRHTGLTTQLKKVFVAS